jgi:murein DD-endopeptidase MepM/ murein hydrolase activator NlpD
LIVRAGTIGGFAVGVAVGALGVTLALFSGGHHSLRPARNPAESPRPASQPASIASERPVPRNEADRTVPAPADQPRLAPPLAGLDVSRLADTFNDSRDGHRHEALDIPAPRGTPVMAVAEGNVAKLFQSKQGGLTVYQFDDSRNWCFYYAHLDRYAPGLKESTLLRKGDVLGYVGTTGDAPPDAPHLHLAVFRLGPEKEWWKGTAVDPLPLLK